MKLLTLSDLKNLIEHEEEPKVSIYLPTLNDSDQTKQNRIRFKNLLTRCQERLETKWPREKVLEFLSPGFDLLDNSPFWKDQDKGLAVFICPGFWQFMRLSVSPQEKTYIGSNFHIMPLIPMLGQNKTYYILLLRQKGFKFYEAEFDTLHEIELPEVPKTIEEFLQYDVTEDHLQVHSSPRGTTAGTDAMFHGQGNIADEARKKKNVERYIKEIVKAVDWQLYENKSPLVLAGVDFDQSVYRHNSSYKYLAQEGISIGLGQVDLKKLQQQAWKIAVNSFDEKTQQCVERLNNLLNSDRISEEIENILPAAYQGKVFSLLIDTEKQIPGTFVPNLLEVDVHKENEVGDEDLLNLAVIYALKYNAEICPVPEEKISEGKPVAAILRY